MFAFLSSRRKARRKAEDWVRLARKVEDYQRDVLPPEELSALQAAREELEALRRDRQTSPERLKAGWEKLERPLRRCGGAFYPRSSWAENVEMLLVAAIIVIGIRSFFIQPFKIPTNSMYPTYNGMTTQVFEDPEEVPGWLQRGSRFLAFGASRYELTAPVSGQLSVSPSPRPVPGRRFFVLPSTQLRFTFFVDQQPVHLDVPLDFDVTETIESFLGDDYEPGLLADGTRVLRTDRRVEAGETFLSFDILTGDQLFVDRISYHFVRPKMGDPFVFRTDNIEHIDEANRNKYYIKRLAGTPGDSVEIDPPRLLRNGEPATGAKAFDLNARQEGDYPGYVTVDNNRKALSLRRGGVFEVPEEFYFALGDNSPSSADSRMWGFVPEREIVGRAIFIYYPFTSRWGPSR